MTCATDPDFVRSQVHNGFAIREEFAGARR